MKKCFTILLLFSCIMLMNPIDHVCAASDGNVHAIVICGRDFHNSSAKKVYFALQENYLPRYKTENKNIQFFSYEVTSSKRHTTNKAFYDALDKAFSKSTSKDLNIIYYTGHGAKDGIPTWMNSITGESKKGIAYDELASHLSKYKGKFVYMANTCFARAFYKQGVSKLKDGDKRFLCLSAVYQDVESLGNIFTDRILKGVGYDSYSSLPADTNKNGMVSVDELYRYTDLKSVVFKPNIDGIGPGSGTTIFQFAYVEQEKSSISMCVGEKRKLSCKVFRSGNVKRKLKWKSSNSSIATVDDNGKVKAKKPGKVKITVYVTDALGQVCKGSESVCTVKITESFKHYYNNVLVKKYGKFKKSQTGTMASTTDRWLHTSGMIGASVMDFDMDGKKEMLVYLAKPLNQEESCLILRMYEKVKGKIKMVSSIRFEPFIGKDAAGHIVLKTSQWNEASFLVNAVKIGKKYYFVCEEKQLWGVFADGSMEDYWILEYKNNKLQYVRSFTQTAGGSSGFEYTGFSFKGGKLKNTELYFSEDNPQNAKYQNYSDAIKGLFDQCNINLNDKAVQYAPLDNKTILSKKHKAIKLFNFYNKLVKRDYAANTFTFKVITSSRNDFK